MATLFETKPQHENNESQTYGWGRFKLCKLIYNLENYIATFIKKKNLENKIMRQKYTSLIFS